MPSFLRLRATVYFCMMPFCFIVFSRCAMVFGVVLVFFAMWVSVWREFFAMVERMFLSSSSVVSFPGLSMCWARWMFFPTRYFLPKK